MPRQCVHQRACVIAVPRVYHKAGRLVDDENRIVLIHDIKGDILGDDLEFEIGRAHV